MIGGNMSVTVRCCFEDVEWVGAERKLGEYVTVETHETS